MAINLLLFKVVVFAGYIKVRDDIRMQFTKERPMDVKCTKQQN